MACLILLALLAVAFLALGFVFWGMSKLDCDLELWLAEKLGRKVDKLRGKVIWITGASSGIGEHLAYECASTGAKLALSGTNRERLENVAKRCIELGQYNNENVLVLPFDMTDYNCHQEKLDLVLDHFKKLDILVNNAGKSQRAMFQDIDVAVDKAVFEVNVFSLVNLTRVVLRYFLEHNRDGQFAVTSSTAGVMGLPCSASYTGSKHALHGYFECLRMELGAKGIAVTIFCPGPIFSNFLANAYTGKMDQKIEARHSATDKRMSTERCAHLMAVALANKLEEVWISLHPFLFLHYIVTYLPSISKKLLPRFLTLERMNKLREGN